MSRAPRKALRDRLKKLSDDHAEKCAIPGCGQTTMRAAGVGLAAFHCRRHVEHRARHGSHWHGTYRAAELKPYLAAATSYVRAANNSDRFITASVSAVRAALDLAGPTELATRLMGMPAHKRAKIAIARLRAAGIQPERIVSIVFAVTALIKEDPGSHRVKEFRTVQIAKAVHRLASGTHKFWEVQDANGRTHRTEMHAFPKSTGPVLIIMGRMLEEPCEVAIDKHLAAVLALKVNRYGQHPRLV